MLCSVLSYRLDWACHQSFFAELKLLRRLRLFINVGITVLVVSREIVRRSIATDVAIYTLTIYVKFARRIVGQFVAQKSHKSN